MSEVLRDEVRPDGQEDDETATILVEPADGSAPVPIEVDSTEIDEIADEAKELRTNE